MGKVRYRIIQDNNLEVVQEIHKVVVHFFVVGDVDDPEIYAAQPIWDWQESPAGKFIMSNAIEPPVWQRTPDPLTWGHKYAIIAELEKKKLSEFYLKFGKPNA